MLPSYTKISIDNYVDNGYPVGSFLYAVLSNDLFGATARADHLNKANLPIICSYIYNYTPNSCWGSPQAVADWLKLHKDESEKAKRIATCDREFREKFEE